MSFQQNLSHLNLLLNAESKAVIETIIDRVYHSRFEISMISTNEWIKNTLQLDSNEDSKNLRLSILDCIQTVVNTNSPENLISLYNLKGQDVNPKLKNLIGSIITNKLNDWREQSILNRVSLPHLKEVSWGVYLKPSSESIIDNAKKTASIHLDLTLDDSFSTLQSTAKPNFVSYELTKESLDTILEECGKIKIQLSKLA